jgi:hypothetical protein
MKAVRMMLIVLTAFLPGCVSASVLLDSIKSSSENQKRSAFSKLTPDYYSLHYAGNVAFLSAGAGYFNRSGKTQLGLMYGYTPAFAAGIRIHSLTIKSVFQLYQFNLKRSSILPYAGVSANFEVGGKSFLFQPSHMPKSYYDAPKSLHGIVSLGVKRRQAMRSRYFGTIEFYGELTAVDTGIWYKMISNEVKFQQIVSSGFGVNLIRR